MRALGVIFVVDVVEKIKDELKGKTILRERNRPPVSSGPVLATHGDLNVNQLKLTFK